MSVALAAIAACFAIDMHLKNVMWHVKKIFNILGFLYFKSIKLLTEIIDGSLLKKIVEEERKEEWCIKL